jgi:ABC-type antimicrobial peptide transport system permease subunit
VALSRLIGATLSNIGPMDPVAFGSAIALLALAAIMGGAIPAWRATRADPAEALRAD